MCSLHPQSNRLRLNLKKFNLFFFIIPIEFIFITITILVLQKLCINFLIPFEIKYKMFYFSFKFSFVLLGRPSKSVLVVSVAKVLYILINNMNLKKQIIHNRSIKNMNIFFFRFQKVAKPS